MMARNNRFQILCDLSPDWRLGCDRLQWILYQRQGSHWRARYFISNKKSALIHLLREEGAYPLIQAGETFLGGLSVTFEEFKQPKSEKSMVA